MNAHHRLTLRTATALGRLAELQRRAERDLKKLSPLAKSALQELSTALEELQVANESLQAQVEELGGARAAADAARHALDELADALPVPALWTDADGVIQKANSAASELLNIGRQHLHGKPMMLFVTDRSALFAAVMSLCESGAGTPVEVDVTVRPRERRPRKMRLRGRRLEQDQRCVWFLHESGTPGDPE